MTILSRIVGSLSPDKGVQMKKLFFSIFLSLILVLHSIPLVAFASMATLSDAELNMDDEWIGDDGELVATSSYADLDGQIDELMTFADIPMLMSDGGDPDIPDYMVPRASVYTSDNKYYTTVRGQYVEMVNSSRAYYTFPARPYGQTYRDIFYSVPKAQLPKPGTYGVTWSMMQGNIGFDVPENARVLIWAGGKNVASQQTSAVATVSENDYGNMYCTGNVTIGYDTTSVSLQIWLSPYNSQLDISCPITAPWNFTLKSQAGGTAVSADVGSGNSSASDQIAQNTADMSDTLKEIVGTISNQLAALWDQMYNLMHVPQLANDDKNTNLIIQSEQQNTEQVTGAIEQHGNFIIEGLKSLFIPSDDFFKAYFDDLYEWFSDRFGFLSFPIDLLVKFSDLVLSSDETDCILTLPSFEIMGESLLQEQSFNLTDFLEENFMFVLTALRMGTGIILIMGFVDLCGDKWDEVMKN